MSNHNAATILARYTLAIGMLHGYVDFSKLE